MKQHSKEYREAYGSLMSVLGPIAGRAMAVAPESTPLSDGEVTNITDAGNALLRELDKERATEAKLRIVKDEDETE